MARPHDIIDSSPMRRSGSYQAHVILFRFDPNRTVGGQLLFCLDGVVEISLSFIVFYTN